jgi:hypothetical protein
MGVLTDKISAVNILGRENLAAKGVELPASSSTYEIMQGIANVESGGAKSYADMVYEHFGVSKEIYPCLFITQSFNKAYMRAEIKVYFSKSYSITNNTIKAVNALVNNKTINISYDFPVNISDVIDEILNNNKSLGAESSGEWVSTNAGNVTSYLYALVPPQVVFVASLDNGKYESISQI